MTMTEIEAKALALTNEVRRDKGRIPYGAAHWPKREESESLEALCRAIKRLEATEARHAAELREQAERFSEAALLVDGDLEARGFAKTGPMRSRLTPFILPAPDPLDAEDPIDALVDLLAPVLTHSQGMAARERENRFRNAIAALKARGV